MKKFVIALMAVMLVAGMAYADKPVPEKPITPYISNSRADEVEPNDDYLTATPLVAGDDMNAAIDPAGEVDYFAIDVTAGASIAFETMPGDIGDTKLYLYDVDGVTELAYNDDIGYPNYYSLIEYDFTADGTYFVAVTGYSASYSGTYVLTVSEAEPPPPAPENDTCEGALALPFGTTFTFDNTGATNAYTTSNGGCTGYTANGNDVVYYVELVEDQQFTVQCQTDYDIAIYLVTDCADIDGTCVAGADNTVSEGFEEIVFDAGENPGTYYLILDGYSSSGYAGIWTVTVDGVVPTDDTTFGGIKSMYR
jgi:redox-sensitive bicupin YhaK (pirin superfamily)